MNRYHTDPYAKEIPATLKYAFEEDDRFLAEVDPTIFHPKGGGQKGDRGTLVIGAETYAVLDAIKDANSGNGVVLVTDRLVPEARKGSPVALTLDWDFRYRQMRLHSVVHLHHCMLEKVLGDKLDPPKTSNIEDGFAFNRYDNGRITAAIVDLANADLRAMIATGAPVACRPDPDREGVRWWNCAGYDIPCGGTHIQDVAEIGDLDIVFSTKKKQQTITFTLV
jgi:Ser-tRNA(Ala) deacylase AlaX